MIYERENGKYHGKIQEKKDMGKEMEVYRITNRQCLHCGGPIHVLGCDTQWLVECEVCGIGVGGDSKDEVVDKIMKTRVPVHTSHAEFESVEY